MIADRRTYLRGLRDSLRAQWPDYRPHSIACHGHSVVTGAFAKSEVRPFDSYPHLLHRALNERFPTALINVIVTALGGEHAVSGAARFTEDVLCHKPDLITIDYALNDRADGLARAGEAWRRMLDACAARDIPVLLLTPTMDAPSAYDEACYTELAAHAAQIGALADEYAVGLVDAFAAFDAHVRAGHAIETLLSWPNHPSRAGHELVARLLTAWFPMD